MHSLFRKVSVQSIKLGATRSSSKFPFSTWTAIKDAPSVATTHAEGDVWDHNFSLTEDGVVNTKLAYRNAATSTILNRLPGRAVGGKVELKNVNYLGKYTLVEAGDQITHEKFEEVLEDQHNYLSADKILFFEDFGLGASAALRVGARLISDNPAHALVFRSLVISAPPRPTDHRARYNGWNFDERWQVVDYIWKGSEYDVITQQTVPRRGERPVVAFLGGDDETVSLQFVQQTAKSGGIAGSNIVAGGQSSVRGVVEALGQAAATMINAEVPESITVPSVVSAKGSETTVFVGSYSDNFVGKVHVGGSLYAAYFSTLTSAGVSAVFGGFIGPASAVPAPTPAVFRVQASPVVVSEGVATVPLFPDNFVQPAKTIVFIDPSASSPSLSADDAVQRLVDLGGDESKVAVAQALLAGARVVVVKSEEEAEKFIR